MKRKQLSIKALYIYAQKFFNNRYPTSAYTTEECIKADYNLLKDFLEYIVKNPK